MFMFFTIYSTSIIITNSFANVTFIWQISHQISAFPNYFHEMQIRWCCTRVSGGFGTWGLRQCAILQDWIWGCVRQFMDLHNHPSDPPVLMSQANPMRHFHLDWPKKLGLIDHHALHTGDWRSTWYKQCCQCSSKAYLCSQLTCLLNFLGGRTYFLFFLASSHKLCRCC